ncbi:MULTISPECIES: AraC family transcriptional regulator [unclassified Mesorhizobium]|uniref:helix-turn-helix domain-containing protein n=1 Tax=unclassified Mesorhizobium TaxID=325217 RepID=UPI001AEF0D61|nr:MULTISPECIES: AraC family transcriptional regulator [unclassified Mesorhizobium]MBZ9894561.1 AraC family transcriptional regulator [Mesorhizobium sp. BR1-1-6]
MSAFVYTFDNDHHCADKVGTSQRAMKIKESMNCKPIVRISPSDLDNLLMTMEVEFVKLSECVVGPGWRLTMATTNAPGIHYDLIGTGRMIIGHHTPIDLRPHTLIIVPAGQSFCIEGADDKRHPATLTITEENARTSVSGALSRFAAGRGEPKVMLICGYFRATYGASIDLFGTLTCPIVEQFGATDQLDHRLSSAMDELVAQEVGTGAMTAALMKQVLVTLLRRSLTTKNLWVERFSMLGDPRIARAFAEMVTHPEFPHSVESLARTACLGRSVFMVRFTRLFGKPPMATLRDLRMRKAVVLLKNSGLSIDQIVHGVGYTSRSSFSRTFRKMHGCDPSRYRDIQDMGDSSFNP